MFWAQVTIGVLLVLQVWLTGVVTYHIVSSNSVTYATLGALYVNILVVAGLYLLDAHLS